MNRMVVLALLALGGLSACAVDVEFTRETKIATIEGNEILHKANATFYGELVAPKRVTKKLEEGDLSTVGLDEFYLEVTEDSVAGPEDRDTLEFILNAELFVRSLNEDSELPVQLLATYERPPDGMDDPQVVDFDVDSSVELLPYFADGFELFTECACRVPADNVSLKGYATLGGVHNL